MNIQGNTDYPVGDGGFEDFTNGVPQPSSFFGQAGWWSVPNSWYVMTDPNGVIYTSPNADFSAPKYAVKMNEAYCYVFFNMMRNLLSGNLRT